MKKYFILLLFFAASCSHQNVDEKIARDLQKNWAQYFTQDFEDTKDVVVFVATNRQSKNDKFGCAPSQFTMKLDNKMRFGACKINVPKNHKIGEISAAKDEKDSLDNVFKIKEEKILSLQEIVADVKKSNRTPLVFVHGFNVDYQEALFRAAQIAYDLKYQGPIILFSWPSGAGDGLMESAMINRTYDNNLNSAKNSVADFKNLMMTLQGEKIKVNLTVHSMGHHVVLNALSELAQENPEKTFVDNLILNAPDFEVDDFHSVVATVKKTSGRITLYCSSNDKAIIVSEILNKNNRVGACLYAPDVETVNVSLIDDSLTGLGHGYYYSREVLGDVAQAMMGIDVKNRLFVARKRLKIGEKYFLRR